MLLLKTFGQAAIIEFFTILFRLLFPNIPILGIPYGKLISIKYIGEIFFFFIMLLPMYSLVNMINENNMKDFCKNNTSAILYAITGFIALILAAGGSKLSSFLRTNLQAELGKDVNPVEAPITPIAPVETPIAPVEATPAPVTTSAPAPTST